MRRLEHDFEGLCAFPLSALSSRGIDIDRSRALIAQLAASGVDSLGLLGSTGSAAYLTVPERMELADEGIPAAAGLPCLVGVSALSTRDVLRLAEHATGAGASALLLSAMNYQPLTDDEVVGLFADVSSASDLPLVVYDNPATTGRAMSDQLFARLAEVPTVVSIKLAGVPQGSAAAAQRVQELRERLPSHMQLGVSGDAHAARGLLAGCDTWYSVLGGVLPDRCAVITQRARTRDIEGAEGESARLNPIWNLFERFGSYRVVSALADILGLLRPEHLPRPVLPLGTTERRLVERAAMDIGALDV